MNKPKVIFFGNGPLADAALHVLSVNCEIVFHARTKDDLETVKQIKANQTAPIYGILASFGVIIKEDLLELFEPEGILNIHPSLLPDLRGPSPIETAILRGDDYFGVSIMKLVKAMDAGPLYYQTKTDTKLLNPDCARPDDKLTIYNSLATTGANWIVGHLESLPSPTPQDDKPVTYTQKFDKTISTLNPSQKSARQLLREISAFSGFPKSKYTFFGKECIIHSAHIANPPLFPEGPEELSFQCADGVTLYIDSLQPAGKKPMDAKSFLNGLVNK